MKKMILARSCRMTIMLTAGLFWGCQKLEEDPKGQVVAERFLTTEADLQAATTACYYPFGNGPFTSFGSTRIWVPLMGGDDITTHPSSNKENFRDFDRFAGSSLNADLRNASWATPYLAIHAANNLLLNYGRVTGRAEVINGCAAQAYFIRAFSYFWLVRVFGSIPLVLDIDPGDTIHRSSVSAVYERIVSDLQDAIRVLPAKWGPDDIGRPDHWAAKALLSQVYLTMAGWPLKDQAKYAPAAGLAKDVIDSSGHDLLAIYQDIFLLSNQNNKEIVWAIQYCTTDRCNWPYQNTQGGSPTNPGEEGGWDDVFFELGFFKRFPAGPRKDATFHTVFTNGTTYDQCVTKHPYIAKYRDGTIQGQTGYVHDYMTNRNLNYLRYAEVLLIYAEARAMSAGHADALAYDAVNRVRKRAGLADLQAQLDPRSFCDSVIAERGWELAGEFSRWFDLVRTEKVEEMAALKDPQDLQPTPPAGVVSHVQYYAPIPYSEVLLNPNLK